jgi:hypothetical protein
MDNIFRGNNEQSHWEDKHEQSYGHFGESYESFCPEYLILATVDTEDDCFGEHISFYKLETMEEKGYDVVWKSKLGEVNSPIPGDFHTIIWLIKGNI